MELNLDVKRGKTRAPIDGRLVNFPGLSIYNGSIKSWPLALLFFSSILYYIVHYLVFVYNKENKKRKVVVFPGAFHFRNAKRPLIIFSAPFTLMEEIIDDADPVLYFYMELYRKKQKSIEKSSALSGPSKYIRE